MTRAGVTVVNTTTKAWRETNMLINNDLLCFSSTSSDRIDTPWVGLGQTLGGRNDGTLIYN